MEPRDTASSVPTCWSRTTVDAREHRSDRAQSEAAPVGRHCHHRTFAAGAGSIDRDRGDRIRAAGARALRSALVRDSDVRPQASCLAREAQHGDADRADPASRSEEASEACFHLRLTAQSHALHTLADLRHGHRGRHVAQVRILPATALAGDTARNRHRDVPPDCRSARAPALARFVRELHHRVFRAHPPPEGHGRFRRCDARSAAASL